jgi:hypothetical protein
MSTIKIKRVERKISWGARDPQTGDIIQKYDACNDKWCPGLDIHTGLLRTGLIFKEEKDLEKEVGLEEGALSKNGSYWNNFSIIIPSDGVVIDTSDPLGKIKEKALLADPTVANSLEESRTNARAEYVITSEGQEAKSKNTKRDIIAGAYATFAKMSNTEITDSLYMFGKDPDVTDAEVSKNILGEILEKDPKGFLDVVGDKLFKDKVWLIRMIRSGVIRKNGVGSGFEMPLYFGDVVLGNGLEDAISYIKDKENQNIYVGLKKAHEQVLKQEA